jgi:LuxR family transcriptional regulator, maltose regulon positive regulatory protein
VGALAGAMTVDTLLSTKLHIPEARANLVTRSRLVARLAEGLRLGRRLTLVSAPPGFGKTTLIREWIGVTERRVAWLSIDEGDNDAARFLHYMIAALAQADDGVGYNAIGQVLPDSSPSATPQELLTAAVTRLINDLAETGTDLLLVLDDYHLINEFAVHDLVAFLLANQPPGFHVVIGTREDPPLPLARMRARDQVTEIRERDLRFTPEEAAAFLNQTMSLGLSAGSITSLTSRTEGWITGLQLAGLALRQLTGTADEFVAAFAGDDRYIVDYLMAEVLDREPEPIRSFLRRTSILDRLSAPLCDALMGGGDSQAMLEHLLNANLFLVPLDNRREWYRYHVLFAEALDLTLTAQERIELHHRAAEWYERNGMMAEAVPHSLSAQDWERTARLIEQTARKALTRGETGTLSRWLQALPEAVARSRPHLCLAYAWVALTGGRLDRVEQWVQAAMRAASPDDAEVEGEVTAIRALLAVLRGDTPSAIQLARQALDSLPADDLFLRGLVAMNLGLAYDAQGDMAPASQAYSLAQAIGQASGNDLVSLMSASQLADIKVLQGKLHEAAAMYRQIIQSAESGQQLSIASMAYVSMGRLLYEWGDLDTATRHLTTAIELGQQWKSADMPATCLVHWAHIKQTQGNADGAQDLLLQAEQALQGHIISPPTIGTVKAYQARLWIRRGNLEAARRWAQEYQARPSHIPGYPGYLRQIEGATWARVLNAQGKPEAAILLLDSLLQVAEAAGQMGNVIELLALGALALQAQGQSAQAMTALERALTLAEPEGYLRIFVDEGEPMKLLLQRMKVKDPRKGAEGGRMRDYVDKLLSAVGERAFHPSSRGPQPLVEPLSERELEVLRLIADGFSNAEIAGKLVIAQGTVKRHINNIYGKLGVQSRTQAVAKAREIRLL